MVIPTATIAISFLFRSDINLFKVCKLEYILEFIHTDIDRLFCYITFLVFRTYVSVVCTADKTDVLRWITIFLKAIIVHSPPFLIFTSLVCIVCILLSVTCICKHRDSLRIPFGIRFIAFVTLCGCRLCETWSSRCNILLVQLDIAIRCWRNCRSR